MTIMQIEKNLNKLVEDFDKDSFVFDLLLAYGMPKATITRLKKGELNQLESKGELLLRKKLFFKIVDTSLLHVSIDELHNRYRDDKKSPRFIIVTDYQTLLAVDTKIEDTLDINLLDLAKYYDFFLPWAGMEKAQIVDENPADIKASEKMAKLYDEIIKENQIENEEDVHALNVFLTRLLFCYFAEDSNIFEDNQFTNAIGQHTQEDGSDLDSYLVRLFEVLDIEDRAEDIPEYLKSFPYVNGGLFQKRCKIPKFGYKSRSLMIESGYLDWSLINPDIFGSMIQAVVTDEYRGDKGMHYTSVPNIMKVIEPLFLDELHEEFEKANPTKLNRLHQRISNLKIFDPACGSGNFLIIAYKELRKLEIKIFKEGGLLISPSIKLSQFYGIELDDFAGEVAKLSLWLAEHQMNSLFKKEFGSVPSPLPLKDGGNIVHGNATRLDWEEVCPKIEGDEIYVLGNPPYLGSSMQNKEQKADKAHVFQGIKNYKNLDYIACWFYKGAKYIQKINAKLAFVTTNSISQGEQVAMLWTHIFDLDIEIFFAHQSFKWTNNAKGNAAVIVSIIGLANKLNIIKLLFSKNLKRVVRNINPYLSEGSNISLPRLNKSICNLPTMVYGNKPTDGGFLILNEGELGKLVNEFPNSEQYIKKFSSGNDFLNGHKRWCIWIENFELKNALLIPPIKKRLEQVSTFRKQSKAKSTVEYAIYPNKFRQITYKKSHAIIIPLTSSERRQYIPFGYIDKETVVSNSSSVIYDAEPWIFAVITSKMHMTWMRTVAGRLKTDYRYSSALVYNTFPFPDINEKQKELLTEHTFKILEEREKHSEKTLAQLYDPNKMPEGLKKAHHELDLAIERCYRKKPFESDEERLEYLFELYEEMIRKEGK